MRFIDNILQTFIAENVITQEEYELYYYCFDIIFSKLIFYSVILGLALILRQVGVTIAYYSGFSAIRYTSGGYHADSPEKCFFLSIMIYLFSIGLIHIVPETIIPEILLGTFLLTFILIWRFAPVDHPNKRFSPREKICYQKKSRGAAIICILLATVLWHFSMLYSWAIAVGCITAAFSVAVASKN